MKKPLLTKATFAAAALRCFEKYGPQRTSMADIAEEVGASRQSIYRFFEDRSALILYILNERITALADSLNKEFSKYTSLEQALVEGTIISIRVSAGDEMTNSIVTHATDHDVEQFLLNGSVEINRSMLLYWGPLLDAARAKNQISPDLSNDEILEWIRHVHTVLRMRDDMSEKDQRRMLQNFFVPSILRKRMA